MELICYLPVSGQSGWELICRNVLIALDKLGVRIELIPKRHWNYESCPVNEEDAIRIQKMMQTKVGRPLAELYQQYPEEGYLRNRRAKKGFCFSIFETDKCPNPWVESLNKITETWTFSKFNTRAYKESGVNRVKTLPIGIDSKLFNPDVPPAKFTNKKDFVFITNGDFTERKNFEGLIEAYVKEFTSADNVCLIMKVHFGGFTRKHKLDCIKKIKDTANNFNSINAPRILFFGDKVPADAMPSFYTAGDCFILTSRGEGVGLPYLEAMACGVPVISTNWGAQTQFLNDSNSTLIPCDIKVIDDMEYIRKCLWALNHSWAHPSVDATRSAMRYIYEFKDAAKKKAIKAREDVEKMTWDNTAKKVIERLCEEAKI